MGLWLLYLSFCGLSSFVDFRAAARCNKLFSMHRTWEKVIDQRFLLGGYVLG